MATGNSRCAIRTATFLCSAEPSGTRKCRLTRGCSGRGSYPDKVDAAHPQAVRRHKPQHSFREGILCLHLGCPYGLSPLVPFLPSDCLSSLPFSPFLPSKEVLRSLKS